MPTDIFLSYAREDRERVRPIAEALIERGYNVWWDKGLRSGEDYRDRIEELLQTSRCVVVAWSRDSLQSDFVMDEASRAHRRKVLLPVFLDAGIDPPLGFGGIHTSDLSGWLENPEDPAFEQFTGDVDTVVRRTAAPAASAAPAARRTTPLRATGGGQQRTTHSAMPRVLRWGRNALIVLGLLFIAALFAPGEPVAETVDPEPAVPVAAPVAAEPVLEGEFRLVLPPGAEFGGSPLVASLLDLRGAAAAAGGGAGTWVERLTTLAGEDAITITRPRQFRIMGDTLEVTLDGDLVSERYRYTWGANGQLVLVDDELGARWTYVRQ